MAESSNKVSSSGASPNTLVPVTSSSCSATNDKDFKRLWIGNLDPKLTEFQLLKLVQRFGTIEHFDFLFHRAGPNAGQPRGYAFVTYQETTSAEKCLRQLDSKRVLDRTISVRWAHQTTNVYPDDEEKLRSRLPALGMKPASSGKPPSKEKTISAIEAKLKEMQREKINFNLTSGKPSSSQETKVQSAFNNSNAWKPHRTNKPYDRYGTTKK